MMAKGPSLLCLTVSKQSSLFLIYACTNFICCLSGAGSENLLFLDGVDLTDELDRKLAREATIAFPGATTGRPELAAWGNAITKATLQIRMGTDLNIVLVFE